MPKYIKDGAYTIVVDERAPSPKRTATPKTFDGSDTEGDELGNSDTEGEAEDGVNFGGGDDDGEEAEEEIDYADPAFILQNLSISTPNFSKDTTRLLPGREELAGVICSQVRYYCYCAIDSFSRNPRPVTILVIGEGFVGSRVINDLIRNGCKDMLRICTRGDLTAEEWRARGIKSDNNIINLLDGEQPDIVIITVENASFTAVCKQLITNYVITESTFVISTTFGFQRRKLYTQLHTPHIFRTFIEPEEIFNAYKKKAFTSLLAFSKAPEPILPEINNVPSSDSISTRSERLQNVPEEELFSPLEASRPQSRAATKDEEAASMYMAKRYGDTRNLVYQLENYYAVRHHGFAEARHKALKNVYGILIDDHGIEAPLIAVPTHRRSSTDEAIEQMSIKKAMKIESKLLAKVEQALTKMSFYHQGVPTYRAHFVSLISSHDLHELKAKKYTREQNNPKSGPNMGFERHRNGPKGAPPPAKTVADFPGRAMYDKSFLEELLRKDEDYSHFVGPGFDLMTAWDRKIENRGSGLKVLQQMSASADPNSPVSAALRAQGLHRPSQSQSHSHSSSHSHSHSAHNTPMAQHGHSHGHGHHAHHALQPEHRQMSQEEIELEAQRELHEYGRRLSNLADHEASSIDHNYMQQYLDSSSRNFSLSTK